MSDLVEWLTKILDEDKWWAVEASRDDDNYTPTGEHWRWECGNDHIATPDPLTMDVLECPEEDWNLSLRSVEGYPSNVPGFSPLPHFAIHTAEEVDVAVGGHIIRHDPAAVLADIAAKRAIIDEYIARDEDADLMLGPDCLRQREWSGLRLAVQLMATGYADRPGYRDEWKPLPTRTHP